MSTNGSLQQQQYIHGLKHDITRAPCSLVPTILHEFHDAKGHQGPICIILVPKTMQDIVEYIGKCSPCAKHLPNMAKYPQQY